ncbi:MAG: TPM domain-containing protein [Bacteroidales bacterium]
MTMISRVCIILFLTIITCHSSKAQWYPDPIIPSRLVNDFAGILNLDESDALEVKLMAFHEETRVQVVIIILSDFGRHDPLSYASTIIDRWGIGYNNDEKGLLILVKPKNQFGPLTVAIAPNSYIKDLFDETVSRSITENEIKPLLAKKRMFQGLNNGTDAVMAHIEGNYVVKTNGKAEWLVYIISGILILAAGAFIVSIFRKRRSSKS